jgi:hypothetical protein
MWVSRRGAPFTWTTPRSTYTSSPGTATMRLMKKARKEKPRTGKRAVP